MNTTYVSATQQLELIGNFGDVCKDNDVGHVRLVRCCSGQIAQVLKQLVHLQRLHKHE